MLYFIKELYLIYHSLFIILIILLKIYLCYIEDFIKCIYTSKAIITDSYHGTIFSIIFEKPFISFINNYRGNTRFKTIRYIFNAYNRIISTKSSIKNKMKLLTKKFIINKKVFEHFKNKSLLFLKKNLLIKNKTICEHI